MRGKRPAFSRGTAGGGKPAGNGPDESRSHWAPPAISVDERNLRMRRSSRRGKMAETLSPQWQGSWLIGFLVQWARLQCPPGGKQAATDCSHVSMGHQGTLRPPVLGRAASMPAGGRADRGGVGAECLSGMGRTW